MWVSSSGFALFGDDSALGVFVRRSKIEVLGCACGDAGKNWSGDETADIEFGLSGSGFVDEHEHDKCGVIGGHKANERADMFIVGVEPLFEFLGGPGFSSDNESWDLGIFCGAFFAGDFDEGKADLVGDLF